MTIYVDENMPDQLARGFDVIQQPLNDKERVDIKVISLKEVYGAGADDEDWIPQLAGQNACVITQDYNIHRIRNQRILCQQHGVGMFYFRPPSKSGFSYMDFFQIIARHWHEIIAKAARQKRPFGFKVLPKSKRLEEMDV
jgi:hypothetical protein